MSTPSIIIHKRSTVPGSVPPVSAVRSGELVLNTADGKLFFKNTAGSLVTLAGDPQSPKTFLYGTSSNGSAVTLWTKASATPALSGFSTAASFVGTYDIVGVASDQTVSSFKGSFTLTWNGAIHTGVTVHSNQAIGSAGTVSISANPSHGLHIVATNNPNTVTTWLATLDGTVLTFPANN